MEKNNKGRKWKYIVFIIAVYSIMALMGYVASFSLQFNNAEEERALKEPVQLFQQL